MSFVLGAILLAHGSIYSVAFLALGVFYLIWLCGVTSRNEKVIVIGFSLIALFFAVWSVISAIYHYYHYALAVAAYGMWAFFTMASIYTKASSARTTYLMILGHGLVLLGFLFVGLSWQIDTAVAIAAIIIAIAQGYSAASEQDTAKGRN